MISKGSFLLNSLLIIQLLHTRPVWHTDYWIYWLDKIENWSVSQKVKPWALKSLCPFAQVTDVFSSSFVLPFCPRPPHKGGEQTDRCQHTSFSLSAFPWPLLLFSPTGLPRLPSFPPVNQAWVWPTANSCYFGLHVSESCQRHCTCRTHTPTLNLRKRANTREEKRVNGPDSGSGEHWMVLSKFMSPSWGSGFTS